MLRKLLPALGFLLVAKAAIAQDTVILKDGTTLRGAVGEMTPGQSLTIALPDGQSRTIEWAQIDRVDIDRAKTAQPAAAGTMVHLDGAPSDAVVQRLEGNGTE